MGKQWLGTPGVWCLGMIQLTFGQAVSGTTFIKFINFWARLSWG